MNHRVSGYVILVVFGKALKEMWLVETRGQESLEVAFKDKAALMWCENATILTGQQ
jgi:hypothetical protein